MINIKKKVKAFIFDMDGTIIKTDHIWDKVIYGTLAKYGIKDIPDNKLELLENLSGMGLKEASEKLKTAFNLSGSVEEIVKLNIALANLQFESQVEYIEGFEQFHNKINQHHIPSGIATNADPSNLNEIVKTMKLNNKFGDNIYCIAHVNFVAKPDPALFLHTAKKLGVDPRDCVVFEDSIHGFKAAKAAGMKCIAVKNSKNGRFMNLVDNAIENYHEAEEALKKI